MKNDEEIVITRAWLNGLLDRAAKCAIAVTKYTDPSKKNQIKLMGHYFSLMGYIESAEEILKK